MSMTYASLVVDIQNTLERYDASTLAQIPSFIANAHQMISRGTNSIVVETYSHGNLTTGQSTYSKPGGWRRNLSLKIAPPAGGNSVTLFLRSYEVSRAYWPNDSLRDVPRYYSDYGNTAFLVSPTPDQDYQFEFCYLGLPELLSPVNTTNALSQYAPDLLLYACLLQSAPFLKDDERIASWQKFYDAALATFNMQDGLRIIDRAGDRSAD